MRITLSMYSVPAMILCAPGSSRERYSALASARYRMSFTSVDLPEPETPVTTVITPKRKAHIEVLQIVLARAQYRDGLAVRLPPRVAIR